MNPNEHQAPHWLQYIAHYTQPAPVVTVADAPLAVESLPANPLPRETKVHLWNDYATGRKPSSGTWEVGTHYIVTKNGMQMECVVIIQAPYYKPITRLRSTVCTESEYQAYLQALVAGVQERKAA